VPDPLPPAGRAPGQDRTELSFVAPLPYDLPVVRAGRGRGGLAELLGAVDVEEVLLRDAHGELP
jgi:hypothetical protein